MPTKIKYFIKNQFYRLPVFASSNNYINWFNYNQSFTKNKMFKNDMNVIKEPQMIGCLSIFLLKKAGRKMTGIDKHKRRTMIINILNTL